MTTQATPIQEITLLDCTQGISRRWKELCVLLVSGVLFDILAAATVLLSGIASEPLLSKVAGVALSVPGMLPFKLSFDRYSELSLLESVRETLGRGLELSDFMKAEIARIIHKKKGPA